MLKKIFNKYTEKPLIFISHSTDDAEYGEILYAMLKECGVPSEQIIFTSAKYKGTIPTSEKIFNFLRDKIDIGTDIIYLLSENYFASPACLNEMGAAWMAKKEYTSFFVPGFDISSEMVRRCCVDINKIGIFLDGNVTCKERLRKYSMKILESLNLKVDNDIINYSAERACKELRAITAVNKTIVSRVKNIKTVGKFKFIMLDALLTTGCNYEENETHWIQIDSSAAETVNLVRINNKIKFKVTKITEFYNEKYGQKSFRNVYIAPESLEIL